MESFSQKMGIETAQAQRSTTSDSPKSMEVGPKKEKKRFLRAKTERYQHGLEFVDIEKNMISLVEKLKNRIDENYYDALLSDEVGGRIPTLIIKKIIEERNRKNRAAKNPKIFFLNFGRDALDENALAEFFKKANLQGQKILVVTEAVEYGKGMRDAILHSITNCNTCFLK